MAYMKTKYCPTVTWEGNEIGKVTTMSGLLIEEIIIPEIAYFKTYYKYMAKYFKKQKNKTGYVYYKDGLDQIEELETKYDLKIKKKSFWSRLKFW